MKCLPCKGTGLSNKEENGVIYAQEVCNACFGKGIDGIESVSSPEVPETLVQKIKKVYKRK